VGAAFGNLIDFTGINAVFGKKAQCRRLQRLKTLCWRAVLRWYNPGLINIADRDEDDAFFRGFSAAAKLTFNKGGVEREIKTNHFSR